MNKILNYGGLQLVSLFNAEDINTFNTILLKDVRLLVP